MANCHSDIRNKVGEQSSTKNDSLLNSSHSFLDTSENHHTEIVENSQPQGSRRRKAPLRIPNKVEHQSPMETDTDSVVNATSSGTQMCSNKRTLLEFAAFGVNIPGKLSDDEQASVNIPGESSDNEHSSTNILGEPSDDEHTSAVITDKPFDNEQASVNVTCDSSNNVQSSANILGEPSDNEHAFANIAGEPSRNEEASVNVTGEPSDNVLACVNIPSEPSDNQHASVTIPVEPSDDEEASVIISDEPSDNEHTSDEEDAQAIFSVSPFNCQIFTKERQLSITSSEDDFIVFERGSDDELDEEEESEDETDSEDGNDSVEEDLDSSSSVIPCKRVRFAAKEELCQIHPMIQWSFAYKKARKGPWEEYARDRARFRNRIKGMEDILVLVFDSKHRERVYKRFQDESTD
ncbi:protein phosphatase 1 regulatory subunit 15 [Leptinotarsa decemlineata]|uniref:protein phosphatase 1 regulatory subunit 15 n=1 Tax=Leptinotarsa decemlineata TaxID=7539 RepID=UPI003D304C2C